MHLNDAHKMIATEMRAHGLLDSGWTWKWDTARRRFGQCNYTRRRLSFSKGLFEINSEDECRNTVLHEVAHALAPVGSNHGPAWRAVCRQIGARPERCAAADANLMASKWRGTCGCGQEFRRERLTDGARNGTCRRCRGRITWRQNF